MRRHLSVVLVAMVTAAVTAGGPVLARTVLNADKVDGLDAVKASATLKQARGNLVAHNRHGVIPRRFVPKVGNASTLDRLDSSAFLQGEIDAGMCTIPEGGAASATCAFSFTFSVPPIVVATLAEPGTELCCSMADFTVYDVSTTGFTLKSLTATGGGNAHSFNFVAVATT
jgi:hypothetical protein